jgi:DNA modification methylase
MPNRQIKLLPTDRLRPHLKNVRVHSKKQIQVLAKCIKRFGFNSPVLINTRNIILAGHARVEAAKQLGLREVPTIEIAGLTEAEERAFVLADNKIAEKAGWDRASLACELNDLAPLLEPAGLDLQIIGFEPAEIDALMGDLVDPEQDPADEPPEVGGTPVSRPGDLWILREHRVICGDARNAAHVRKLMGDTTAALVFTDPPYNVRVASIGGRGKTKHREFAAASGEMTPAQFTKFLADALSLAAKHSEAGSIHYVCIDWRHLREMLDAGEEVYTELKNLVVWAKTNAGQGTFYRSQHELIFVFKNGDATHLNNFELGQHGRRRSNVWTYAGVNTFRAGRHDDLAVHPTVKPIGLVTDAMRDCSRRGDIVLDPFLGSGTTILAAERVGRRGYGLEIDPLYVDATVRRWQNFTKRDAVLEGTAETFDEVEISRNQSKSAGINSQSARSRRKAMATRKSAKG